ncbi:hypothetical protein [uncultured Flavobacterium sp.]|uniref:hypothetical protein n=1 Tax=uncultured Flavobacterium sp. TaxID=165435 RepID=UPI00292CB46A|nr:hypothetical protein [uncultured Flavobacterium sp.]
MEKEKVLVRDNQGIFLRMFKRKFKDEIDFHENSFSAVNENESLAFDRCIYVVYNKSEFLEFLKLDKSGANILVCLFNKQLYTSLTFLNELKNLIMVDGSKSKAEITKDLKSYFKGKTDFTMPTTPRVISQNLNSLKTKFSNFDKTVYFLM